MACVIVKGDADTLETTAVASRLFPSTAQYHKVMPSPLKKHWMWDPPSYCKAPESSKKEIQKVPKKSKSQRTCCHLAPS